MVHVTSVLNGVFDAAGEFGILSPRDGWAVIVSLKQIFGFEQLDGLVGSYGSGNFLDQDVVFFLLEVTLRPQWRSHGVLRTATTLLMMAAWALVISK